MSNARSRWLFLFLFLPLLSCKQDPDAQLQKKLTGDWVLESTPFSTNFQGRLTVDASGNYAAHTSMTNALNQVQQVDMKGYFRVKSGWLIDAATNFSQLADKAQLPYISTNRIVLLTNDQFVVRIESPFKSGEVVYRKAVK
jgi:hypothetical protein